MMSQIVRSMRASMPCSGIGICRTFFVTFAPSVVWYLSSKASSTNRRMRDVLPTAKSPTRQTFALRISDRIVALRHARTGKGPVILGRINLPGAVISARNERGARGGSSPGESRPWRCAEVLPAVLAKVLLRIRGSPCEGTDEARLQRPRTKRREEPEGDTLEAIRGPGDDAGCGGRPIWSSLRPHAPSPSRSGARSARGPDRPPCRRRRQLGRTRAGWVLAAVGAPAPVPDRAGHRRRGGRRRDGGEGPPSAHRRSGVGVPLFEPEGRVLRGVHRRGRE